MSDFIVFWGKCKQRRCNQLCIIAVPRLFDLVKLCALVNIARTDIEEAIMVVSPHSDQHSLLLKFISDDAAERCHERCNGVLFEHTRPEVCYCVYVLSICFEYTISSPTADSTIVGLTTCPDSNQNIQSIRFYTSTATAQSQPCRPIAISNSQPTTSINDIGTNTSNIKHTFSNFSSALSHLALIAPKLILGSGPGPDYLAMSAVAALFSELPICPACLTRLDTSVSGLIALAYYDFDQTDTAQTSCWLETRCACCTRLSLPAELRCDVCTDGSDELWICLICASVGCSRYQAGHAMSHFEQSGHRHALELKSLMIWDYVYDAYTHRVCNRYWDIHPSPVEPFLTLSPSPLTIDQTNGMDISPINHGPPVTSDSNILIARTPVHEAVSPSDRIQLSSEAARELMTAKIESIATGYNRLLNSQLQQQAEYFEQLQITSAGEHERRRINLELSLDNCQKELHCCTHELDEATHSLSTAQSQCTAAELKFAAVDDEHTFLSDLNRSLLADQSRATDSLAIAATAVETRLGHAVLERRRQVSELERRVAMAMRIFETT